jgi:hypothetical protein
VKAIAKYKMQKKEKEKEKEKPGQITTTSKSQKVSEIPPTLKAVTNELVKLYKEEVDIKTDLTNLQNLQRSLIWMLQKGTRYETSRNHSGNS